MGSQGGSESYWVPFIGQEIPSETLDAQGKRQMRQAGVEDCYFFPHMRCIMTFDGMDVPVYDGPAWDWSGMMPAEYTADLWPWERIGYSLVRDIYELERARQHGERAIDQVIRHRMDPSIGYDNSKLTSKEAEGFDPWRERGRLGFDGDVTEASFRTLIPGNLLEIPQAAFQWQQYCSDEEDYLLGLNQIGAMARAKLGVDGDAIEKLLELAGPLVKDISRTMEPPTRDVMEITKFNIFQWKTTRELMSYVGPDGVTPVTLDFDPTKLYPSHMPGRYDRRQRILRARAGKVLRQEPQTYDHSELSARGNADLTRSSCNCNYSEQASQFHPMTAVQRRSILRTGEPWKATPSLSSGRTSKRSRFSSRCARRSWGSRWHRATGRSHRKHPGLRANQQKADPHQVVSHRRRKSRMAARA